MLRSWVGIPTCKPLPSAGAPEAALTLIWWIDFAAVDALVKIIVTVPLVHRLWLVWRKLYAFVCSAGDGVDAPLCTGASIPGTMAHRYGLEGGRRPYRLQ